MPNQALLLRALVELADNLVDDFDVVDLLCVLSDRCVAAVDVAAAGVMLASPGGALQVVASSSDAMRTLELFQLQADEGPCVDAYRTGTPVVNLDLGDPSAGVRWPRFAARAQVEGFRSVHSLPMRLRGRTLGALNMFRTVGGALGDPDVAAAQALADIATIAIVQHRAAVDVQTLNDQLSTALNSRIVIEQAKGRMSEGLGVDMGEAFRLLRDHARKHNSRLVEVATKVADGTMDLSSLGPLSRGS